MQAIALFSGTSYFIALFFYFVCLFLTLPIPLDPAMAYIYSTMGKR